MAVLARVIAVKKVRSVAAISTPVFWSLAAMASSNLWGAEYAVLPYEFVFRQVQVASDLDYLDKVKLTTTLVTTKEGVEPPDINQQFRLALAVQLHT